MEREFRKPLLLPAGAVRFVLDTLDGEVEVGRAFVPPEDVVIALPAR